MSLLPGVMACRHVSKRLACLHPFGAARVASGLATLARGSCLQKLKPSPAATVRMMRPSRALFVAALTVPVWGVGAGASTVGEPIELHAAIGPERAFEEFQVKDIVLFWQAPADAGRVSRYEIVRDPAFSQPMFVEGEPAPTSFHDTATAPHAILRYRVRVAEEDREGPFASTAIWADRQLKPTLVAQASGVVPGRATTATYDVRVWNEPAAFERALLRELPSGRAVASIGSGVGGAVFPDVKYDKAHDYAVEVALAPRPEHESIPTQYRDSARTHVFLNVTRPPVAREFYEPPRTLLRGQDPLDAGLGVALLWIPGIVVFGKVWLRWEERVGSNPALGRRLRLLVGGAVLGWTGLMVWIWWMLVRAR